MKKQSTSANLPEVHFVDPYLQNPTNPVTVNLIGAGGTGSHVLAALAALHQALIAFEHPGLQVTVFDDKNVSPANMGRQAFFDAEIGLNKAVAIVTRANRGYGTNWKAVPARWTKNAPTTKDLPIAANLVISCVDTAAARFDIAHLLTHAHRTYHGPENILYWIDFGNSRHIGQVILSTPHPIKQPNSKQCKAHSRLPLPTVEFKDLFASVQDNDEPSCSVQESLSKQALFINRSLAPLGGMLIENLFRQSILEYRGFFLNLAEFNVRPFPIAGIPD